MGLKASLKITRRKDSKRFNGKGGEVEMIFLIQVDILLFILGHKQPWSWGFDPKCNIELGYVWCSGFVAQSW